MHDSQTYKMETKIYLIHLTVDERVQKAGKCGLIFYSTQLFFPHIENWMVS
jgi:hypothetical protein